jgi:YHS domain-containing protein
VQRRARRSMAKRIDPVCGMQVDEENVAGVSQHRGQDYYFCSQICKIKFDDNPEKYGQSNEQYAG